MEQYVLFGAIGLAVLLLLLLILITGWRRARGRTYITLEELVPEQPKAPDDLPPPPDLRPRTWQLDIPMSMLDGAIHDDFVRLLDRFITIVMTENDVSASVLMQLTGYHQAAKFIDHMEAIGVIGPSRLPLSREIHITADQYQNILRKRLYRYRSELDTEDVEFVEHLLDRLQRDVTLIRSGVLTADNLSDDLLADVDLMDDPLFKKWCTDLLTRLGYRIEPPTTPGHGADLFAEKEDVLYVLRCRCGADDVESDVVQAVFSGQRYYRRHVAVVMTNRLFTPQARSLGEEAGVLLWDRNKLKLLIEKESLLPF